MRVSRALQTNERCPSGNARIPRTDRRFRPTPPSDGWPAPLAASPAPAERRRTSDTVVCNRTQFFLGALFTFLAIGMIWHDVKKWYRVRRSKAKRELFSWWGGVADNVILGGGVVCGKFRVGTPVLRPGLFGLVVRGVSSKTVGGSRLLESR